MGAILGHRGLLLGDSLEAKMRRLFNGGVPGVMYDYTNPNYLYQTAAGTSLVSANGDPIGRVMDVRLNMARGTDIIVNGGFDADTGWSKGGGWSITGGVARAQGILNSSQYLIQPLPAPGLYEVTYSITRYVSGTCRSLAFSTVTSAGGLRAAVGTYTDYIQVDAVASLQLRFQPESGANCDFDIDNVSARLIAGNHATQVTSTKRSTFQNASVFDGVDDTLTTPPINFTGTDKITVVASVYAPSAATGIFLELSAGVPSNNGSFYITDNETKSGLSTYRMRGSNIAGGVLTNAPPDLAVYSYAFDIAADSVTARVNGTSAPGNMSAGADAGIGNFGNYPLYIAMRAGASNPFNGNIYRLAVIGRALTASELTGIAEAWANQPVGVI